ncbi:MAG: pentapeptide repeat-containing protein [Chitinophagales bacterium]
MNPVFIEDEQIEGVDFSKKTFAKGEYEECRFLRCVFSDLYLSQVSFGECVFEHCDLSMANMATTTLRDVRFKDSKLLGVHFEDCNSFLLSMTFEGCQLNLSSFYKLNLKQTVFKDCSLREVDFSEADLSGVVFDNCDFAGAVFDRTILEKADFRTSYNYSIDPENNRIKKAKFSMGGIVGLLDKYGIEVT